VNGQRMDQTQRYWFVLFAGDGVLNAGFQHLTTIDDRPDLRNGAE
jgi:hypothetical protein